MTTIPREPVLARGSLDREMREIKDDVLRMGSMVADLLMLQRFYVDPKPWKNLRKIHQSVLADYAPARRLGLTLHQRGD